MFIRVVRRKLRDDIALDIKLLGVLPANSGTSSKTSVPEKLDNSSGRHLGDGRHVPGRCGVGPG